ncbi:MAG: hypothetical protein EOP07_24090 [Proteobacteria bacterium]|nr:MAG: hypothetical protein EOP07_24090 [Pseudomonadota bacterium]
MRRTTLNLLLAILGLLLNFSFPLVAYSWGAQGHQKVAQIAWDRMDTATQKAVTDLLKSGNDAPTTNCKYQSIEEASTWLDCVRGAALPDYFANYYHADRFTHCPNIVIPTKCKSGHCASDALNVSILQLKDKTATLASRRIALKVIIHLIGDLHQPLHVERDANSFMVDQSGSTVGFHEYWDKDVVTSINSNRTVLDTIVQKHGASFLQGTVNDWVKDTFEESKSVVYQGPLKSLMCNQDPVKFKVMLSEDYRQDAAHYSYFKIAQAGVRLAQLLTEILKP